MDPFRYFNSSPKIIRLAVMMYIRYPLSLRRFVNLTVRIKLAIDAACERLLLAIRYVSESRQERRLYP